MTIQASTRGMSNCLNEKPNMQPTPRSAPKASASATTFQVTPEL